MAERRMAILFLALTIIQAAHSIVEYFSRLYDRFAFVTGEIHGIISIFPVLHMHKTLFAALNIVFVALLVTICINLFKGRSWAKRMARLIAVVEIVNGLAHLSAAVYTGGYFPGSVSAAGLLIVGILLLRSTEGVWVFHRASS